MAYSKHRHDVMLRTGQPIGDADFPIATTPLQWIDLTAEIAADAPGPGQYRVEECTSLGNIEGGRWGKNRVKSDVDWLIHKAKELPGPGQYDEVKLKNNEGGRFGTARRQMFFEPMVKATEHNPGPGQYQRPLEWASKPKTEAEPAQDVVDQRWETAKKLGKRPEQIYGWRARPPTQGTRVGAGWGRPNANFDIYKEFRTPGSGPGSVPVRDQEEIQGGRISKSKYSAWFETELKEKSHMPSPGQYKPVEPSLTKYRSWKIPKISDCPRFPHERDETPGPGAYTPELPKSRAGGAILRSETPTLKQYHSEFVLKTSIRRPKSTPLGFSNSFSSSFSGYPGSPGQLSPLSRTGDTHHPGHPNNANTNASVHDGSQVMATGRSSQSGASERDSAPRRSLAPPRAPSRRKGSSVWANTTQ